MQKEEFDFDGHMRSQKDLRLYKHLDFSGAIQRFTLDPGVATQLEDRYLSTRPQLLADEALMSKVRCLTLTGDPEADAYAALSPVYGVNELQLMLMRACELGINEVKGAPNELKNLIAQMEKIPEWFDAREIEMGVELERQYVTSFGPMLIRAAIMASYLNAFVAMPFVVDTPPTAKRAERRAAYVSSFFAATMLPGALERGGIGFKLAAQTRLQHALLRSKFLSAGSEWDYGVFGVPIPLIDQIAIGLFPIFSISRGLTERGYIEFSSSQKAVLNVERFRCHLMGVPKEAMPDSPTEITRLMLARNATLRRTVEHEVTRALIASTLSANLVPKETMAANLFQKTERIFSKWIFCKMIVLGDVQRANRLGVHLTTFETVISYIVGFFCLMKKWLTSFADKIPTARQYFRERRVMRLRSHIEESGTNILD